MTWVKICGTTNLDDALLAVDAGADAVGFVFYEKSPRNVFPEAAAAIVEKLPSRIEKIGVFVNESPEKVSALADDVGLSAIQLHGDEYLNPEQYAIGGKLFFGVPVIGVLREMRESMNASFVFPKLPKSSAILLDSGTKELRGGTGKTFAWGEAHGLVQGLSQFFQVVIAGGLTPDNVSWAAEYLHPWGVDVVSGVEARPGKKDPAKVRAFVKAVRDKDRRAS
jgi:phosphoribosylanthranilate isomerase